MTLGYDKFLVTPGGLKVGIRCTACGRAEHGFSYLRLDDAVYWAERHECDPQAVA